MPLPKSVESCATPNNAPAAEVVCTVPSGNLYPPSVVSIIPCTVNSEVGVWVPMPTFPNLSSKICESPMKKVFEPSTPVHLAICPGVPLPPTGFEAAAGDTVYFLFCLIWSCASDKLADNANIAIIANSL